MHTNTNNNILITPLVATERCPTLLRPTFSLCESVHFYHVRFGLSSRIQNAVVVIHHLAVGRDYLFCKTARQHI